jgi:hypothetical protein
MHGYIRKCILLFLSFQNVCKGVKYPFYKVVRPLEKAESSSAINALEPYHQTATV